MTCRVASFTIQLSFIGGYMRQFFEHAAVAAALLLLTQVSLGQTAGPNNAGTGSNVNGPGTITWSNPGNMTTTGSPYATATLTTRATSEYLQGTNYGFTIPANATIDGISVSITRRSSSNAGGNSINDVTVRLLKAGVLSGNNKATTTDWPTSLGTANYGSETDLWGTTWTPDQINASNFGVALSAFNQSSYSSRTATVDGIQVTLLFGIE